MISSQWTVERSGKVKKSLKKYKSDKHVWKKFKNAIKALVEAKDPAELAYKKPPGGRCIFWITNSVRMLYWMNHEKKIIYLGILGDHKEVYGWD